MPSSQVQNQESIAQFGEVVVSTTEIVTGFLLLGGEVVNVNPALGIEQAGSGVAVGVAVGVASGSGVGVRMTSAAYATVAPCAAVFGTMSCCSAGSAAAMYVDGSPSSPRTMLQPWAIALAL